jgi:hypothetical protein
MGKNRYAYEVLLGISEGNNHLKDRGADGKIIHQILKKQDGEGRLYSHCRERKNGGFCDPIKGENSFSTCENIIL